MKYFADNLVWSWDNQSQFKKAMMMGDLVGHLHEYILNFKAHALMLFPNAEAVPRIYPQWIKAQEKK